MQPKPIAEIAPTNKYTKKLITADNGAINPTKQHINIKDQPIKHGGQLIAIYGN